MKQAVLDTNFIITCVKQKIDFFNEIKFKGMEILIPEEVLNELNKLSISGKKLHIRKNATLALKVMQKNKFKKIKLNANNVDKGLLNISKKDKNIIIATLDSELKRRLNKPNIVIRGRKKIEVI